MPMFPQLERYIAGLEPLSIPAERRGRLDQLAAYVRDKRAAGEAARLVFICTHNSRRSQLGQVWAATAAAHGGVSGVETYSGGTEVDLGR